MLVDFKGGATFLDSGRAPHVAAVITNLADEAPLVARMRDALAGEINRRQQMLRAAGNFVSVAAYEQARGRARRWPPLPTLFIIVDEFSELLSQHPDFAELFVAIGRLGRSLGMHLLLASQRLDEGRLRGLEAHLSYRICLKTLSAGESRAVLGTPDAYQLPEHAGRGLPEHRDRRADPVPDRVRLGRLPPATRADRCGRRRRCGCSPPRPSDRSRPAAQVVAAPDRVAHGAGPAVPVRDRPRTRSGCLRWTRRRAGRCCPTPAPGRCACRSVWWTDRSSSAGTR